MSDFVEKLKAHGWSRPLTTGHQRSEYKEEFEGKPNMKAELARIDGQLPYLTQSEAPMTKVIAIDLHREKYLTPGWFRRSAKMTNERNRRR